MINSDELLKICMEAPVGICALDGPHHKFSLANHNYMMLLFGEVRDLIGQPVREVLPDIEEGQWFFELLDKVYKTGEPQSGKEVPTRAHLRDGTTKNIFINFSLQSRRNIKGEVIGILVIVYDVTKHVEHVQNIIENADLLRLITDRLPALVSYMDTNMRYRFVNKAYTQWFGRSCDEIEGKTRAELVSDDKIYGYISPYEARAFAGEPVSFELTLTKPSGEFVNLDTEYLPDIDPKTGEVRGIVGVGQDVTDRKQALSLAEASEFRFRSLTDTIPQLMWTSSPEGKVNYANERCLHYTGIPTQEKFGDGWTESIYPNDLERVTRAWMISMKTGAPFKEEYRLKRFDGAYRWFIGRAIPIRNPKGIIQYWIGTAMDIEEEKRTAQELSAAKEVAEKANSTKSAFLANMSHEIRTPLGAILGFSSLLKDPALTEDQRHHYIETINRNGQSLTRIIDDILDLAKVEAGQLDVEEIYFSFRELMAEVIDLFKEKALEKNIYLSYNINDAVPEHLLSDPTRLRQILINIVGNAVKFTDVGGVSIHADLKSLSGGHLQIAVEVKDTGCGLNDEQNERLFKPFTQADNTTTRRYGGTGLGLALSKRLSQALGGDIAVSNFAPNKGCTFTITFLAKAAATKQQQTAISPSAKTSQTPNKLLENIRVLLVDDSPDNQLLVQYILKKNGADVEVASNGLEAIEKATARTYDIVLMDIQMPHMDGYQATSALLTQGYKTPIVALTAHAMVEDRAKTQAAGFVCHLTKPLNNTELIQSVAQYSKKTH